MDRLYPVLVPGLFLLVYLVGMGLIRLREAQLPIRPRSRPLWRRVADTDEGNLILAEARHLSRDPRYAHLSDAELIRLAYWGASGNEDVEGRANNRRLSDA